MKPIKTYFLIACSATAIALSSCQSKSDKITDIPLTSQSDDAKSSVKKGLAAMDAGDGQAAKTFFSKAIEQDPKLAIAYVLRSGTNEKPKEFTDHMNAAKANLEGASNWEKWYYDYYSTFQTSDWNKRMEVTQQIANAYPDAPRAQLDLGNVYAGGNQLDKARACYEKAVTMDPKWAGGYTAMVNSCLFFEPKDFKKAEANALKVVELAPQSPGAEIALGDCYRAQMNLEKAREAYGKAVSLDPSVSEPYFKKGHANTFLGNYDEARQNYSEGGKHDESQISAITFCSYTYLYDGDFKSAMNYLTDNSAKLDASGESNDKVLVSKMTCLDNCANICMHSGDVAKLKETIAAMTPLSVEMGNQVGTEEAKLNQKATIAYWESIAASMEGNYDAAKSKAEEIKSTLETVKDPYKLNTYEFAMGYMAMKQKNYGDASGHFGKIMQPSVYQKYWTAMAEEGAGNKDKAKAIYKDIADYNFNGIDYALIRKEVKTKMAAL